MGSMIACTACPLVLVPAVARNPYRAPEVCQGVYIMKVYPYFAFFALCSIAEPVTAQSQDAAAARKQIEASYRRENAALAKEDVAGVLVHYDREYIYRGPKGRVYRTPQLQPVLVGMFRLMSGIRGSTKVQRFALRRKEAAVRVTESVNANMKDPSTG